MKVALFGKDYKEDQQKYLQQIIDELVRNNNHLCLYQPFYQKVKNGLDLPENLNFFNTHHDLVENTDMLFSIGGDGTMLDTIPFVRDSGIPILGINLGRLGFLSSVSKNEIKQALESIFKGDYYLDKRALLELVEPKEIFGELNFALNDLTIYRNNTTSLVVVHVYVDDKFLNSYWGDGLIVSTPTGSTAYSLSVGGPIMSPGSQNFVIAPIASHNLTVRPIVIQDSSTVRIRIGGREDKYLMTMDSRHSTINREDELVIKRCGFEVNMVEMNNKDFFSTIRDKLLWGVDNRN
ncbi:MAG: NAD kinase [Marinilabiliales bacterium]|jgi:NAD+ kinase|nr:MAG: NAD kinase [Marinilabiliales bacterium]